MVGIIWAYLLLFSIVLAVFRNFYEKKKREQAVKQEEEERKKSVQEQTQGSSTRRGNKINESNNISNYLNQSEESKLLNKKAGY